MFTCLSTLQSLPGCHLHHSDGCRPPSCAHLPACITLQSDWNSARLATKTLQRDALEIVDVESIKRFVLSLSLPEMDCGGRACGAGRCVCMHRKHAHACTRMHRMHAQPTSGRCALHADACAEMLAKLACCRLDQPPGNRDGAARAALVARGMPLLPTGVDPPVCASCCSYEVANIVAISRVTDANKEDAGMNGSELAAVAEAGGAVIVEAAGECLGAAAWHGWEIA